MYSTIRQWLERLGHVLGNDLGYFAASLSFYTLFSLIPMFWVLFFVLSKFDAFDVYYLGMKAFLIDNLVPAHTEVVDGYLDTFLENSRSMGLWGVVYVLVTSVMFFQNFQYVLNKIFRVENHEMLHVVSSYLLLAMMMPVTMGGSFLLSDLLQGLAGNLGSDVSVYQYVSYMMIWLLFFLIYRVAPNIRIGTRVVVFVSLVVAFIWILAKQLFIYYVLANKTYASLYGSFSMLLFFMLWIYLSWFMLLHGMRVCYQLERRLR